MPEDSTSQQWGPPSSQRFPSLGQMPRLRSSELFMTMRKRHLLCASVLNFRHSCQRSRGRRWYCLALTEAVTGDSRLPAVAPPPTKSGSLQGMLMEAAQITSFTESHPGAHIFFKLCVANRGIALKDFLCIANHDGSRNSTGVSA